MENQQNNNVLVSVVMATYNGERFLRQAVESILEQTFFSFEFLIIDDCSSGQSPQILGEFAARDKRIKIIVNAENLGLTASLNKGLRAAKGKYIARMDDDDIALPNRLYRQFSFMESHSEIALCGAMADIISEQGEIIGEKRSAITGEDIKKKLLFNNQMVHSAWFARRSVLDELGFYDETFKKAQDYELLLRIASKRPVCNLPEKLIRWRKRGDSLSFKDKQQQKYALKARWFAISRYGYPKPQGIFHIALRTLWLLVPSRVKERVRIA